MFSITPETPYPYSEKAPLGETAPLGGGEVGMGGYGAVGATAFLPPPAAAAPRGVSEGGNEVQRWPVEAVAGGVGVAGVGGASSLRAYKQMRDRVAGPDEALPSGDEPEKGCAATCLPKRSKRGMPEQAELPGR